MQANKKCETSLAELSVSIRKHFNGKYGGSSTFQHFNEFKFTNLPPRLILIINMMTQNTKHKNNKDLDSMAADKALNIAQGIKKENQTKTQTKLVSQGIAKGIELYKKQQNKKQRDIDKNKKKELKNKLNSESHNIGQSNQSQKKISISQAKIAWGLLLLSWLFFLVYFFK